MTDAERQDLQRILQANPISAHGYQLKEHFRSLMTQRDVVALGQ